LGESFSGPVAVRLAASASGRLKGLVLCCSFVRNPRPVLAVARPVVGVLPVGLAPVGLMSRFVLGRFGTKELAAAIGGAVSRVSPAALRARMRAVLGVDVSAELARVNAPILYLRASDDRVVPRAASELVSRLVPSVRVVEIAGPHFLLQASAGEAARVVGACLGEVGDD
jgi:pimeloyl-ACP methyl ester carboxylesterase